MDVEQILSEVDRDGNGVIDYEEFCAMMRAGLQGADEGAPTARGQGTLFAGMLGV
jgi:hypothetical protein